MSAGTWAANTFSNNVALSGSNQPGNTVNPSLASSLAQILAQGSGVLPASIGSILSPTSAATIGLAYLVSPPA